jgi:hypothetical protein
LRGNHEMFKLPHMHTIGPGHSRSNDDAEAAVADDEFQLPAQPGTEENLLLGIPSLQESSSLSRRAAQLAGKPLSALPGGPTGDPRCMRKPKPSSRSSRADSSRLHSKQKWREKQKQQQTHNDRSLTGQVPASGADAMPRLLSIRERERRDRQRSSLSTLSTQNVQQLQGANMPSSRWENRPVPEVHSEDWEDDVSMLSGHACSDTSSYATSGVTQATFNSMVRSCQAGIMF